MQISLLICIGSFRALKKQNLTHDQKQQQLKTLTAKNFKSYFSRVYWCENTTIREERMKFFQVALMTVRKNFDLGPTNIGVPGGFIGFLPVVCLERKKLSNSKVLSVQS